MPEPSRNKMYQMIGMAVCGLLSGGVGAATIGQTLSWVRTPPAATAPAEPMDPDFKPVSKMALKLQLEPVNDRLRDVLTAIEKSAGKLDALKEEVGGIRSDVRMHDQQIQAQARAISDLNARLLSLESGAAGHK